MRISAGRPRVAGGPTWGNTAPGAPPSRIGAGLLILLLGTAQAFACRCAPRALSEYFTAADIVMVAKVDGVTGAPEAGELTLALTPTAAPYKGDPAGHTFITAPNSAACGLPPLLGHQYLIFASRDPQRPKRAYVTTCEGSRLHDPSVPDGLRGFDDVPGPRVVGQLEILQGMDALERLHATATHLRLRGLLDLKSLTHGGHVTLRAAPADDAAVISTVHSMEDVPSREATYEFPAAMVVDRREGWYAIRLREEAPDAIGWLHQEEAGTYWPLTDLLTRRLAYLNGHWDGLLWTDAAGAGRVLRVPPGNDRPASIVETADLAGSTWLRVQILATSPCEGGDPQQVRHSGWIPAWAPSGSPNAWFYSRGC